MKSTADGNGRIAPYDTQLELFHLPRIINCTGNGSARNAYGYAVQEIVCRALELTPIRINGNYPICFDAYHNGIYYEIKSAHTTGRLVIYDWRIHKEKTACICLFYAILVHSVRNCRADVVATMSKDDTKLLLVPAEHVHRLALECTLRKHKTYTDKRNWYNREGYCEGYRNLDIKKVQELLTCTHKIPNPYGAGTMIEVHTTSEGEQQHETTA